GAVQQFTATGTFSDNSTQDLTTVVTWSSSDLAKAAISNAAGTNGQATALGAGTASITATSGSVSGSSTLTVTAAVPRAGTFAAVDSQANPTLGLRLNVVSNPAGNGFDVTGVAASTSGFTWDLAGTMTFAGALNATGTGTGA